MRRRLLLFLASALTLLFAACGDYSGDGSIDDPSSTTEVVEGADLSDLVVVFSPDESETDSYGEATTWTPGIEDLLDAEAALAEHIDANPDLGVDALDTYARQYVGVGEGDHVVSVNALCEASLETLDDWEDGLIGVADGGTCFWQATVDLATGTVDPFTVNGSA